MKFSKKFISATRSMSTLTESVPAPYLRRSMTVRGDVTAAEMTVCGLGFYRFWLNGAELTRGHLSPYISNPDDILDYDRYDLTGSLGHGENVLGFQLGNGMENAYGGYIWDFEQAAWRAAPKLAIRLAITYGDGTEEIIECDEQFRCAPSPVISDDLRQGEIYDANREIPGWNLPGFDADGWTPAIVTEAPRGKPMLCAARPIVITGEHTGKVLRKSTLRFGRRGEDENVTGWLYDFGENQSGLCRLRIRGKKGQRISWICGEHLTADGDLTVDNIRFVRPSCDGLPLYLQKDEYICRGDGVEEWMPAFTYHGFRYALVSGITEEQATPELLTYVTMNTELPERGAFHCSDETLNRLQRMTRVATLANFFHFPTDCPHREKNGWTADAALSTEHTLLNLDPTPNYYEWMRHIRAAMREDGALPGIVPTGGWGFDWGNGPAWDQVLVTIPWMVYRYRGRKDIVEESLPCFLRYVHYLTTRLDEKGLLAFGLGDWCAPYGPRSPQVFTDSVISMDLCRKVAFLFDECGKPEQAKFCRAVADDLRKAIRANLIDWSDLTAVGSGESVPGCQTSQAMAIYYDVFSDEEKPAAFKVLLGQIHAENEHLDTGVLGTRVIFHVLAQFGEADLAARMIADRTPPSFGYWVEMGETSLIEDFLPEQNGGAASRNHHFFGDISAFFIRRICGIDLNPDCRDVNHAILAPNFVDLLTHAEAHHDAPAGRIALRWARNDDGTVTMTVEFPDAMHGEFKLPRGWAFADGLTSIPAVSGTWTVRRV